MFFSCNKKHDQNKIDSEKITAVNAAAVTALTKITFQKGVNK
jgi:hypothetical protein